MKRLTRPLLALALAGQVSAAAAALDIAGLDRAADPCTDFYAYVNQRWIAATEIPGDRSSWGTAAIVDRRNEEMLLKLIEAKLKDPKSLPAVGTPERKVLEYFRSGMNLANIRHWQLKPLAPFLGPIAQVEDAEGIARIMGDLHTREISPGFDFDVSADRKDSSRYLASLSQGGLGLPDRDYYLLDDERTKKIRDAYRAHLVKVLTLNGDKDGLAERNAERIIALETELARASMTAVERRDVDKTYNRMSVAQLEKAAPGFPWRTYLESLGAARVTEFNVQQPAFMARFAALLAERPIEDWRAYLRWHLLQATSDKLDHRYESLHHEFYERTLRGLKEPPPRARRVLGIISGRYGEQPMAEGLGRLFVQERFPPQAKARALELVQNVKDALADRLKTVDWMTEETRARSLEKLAAMRIKIGYPDKWKDVSGADVGKRLFVENWMAANIFAHRRDVSRVGGPVERDEWFMSPHILNAYYSGSNNEIVFPAAILQPPFFDPRADDALNYGGIGMVIGHEITHGFDNRGRRYDKDGNLRDWWTKEDEQRYNERAAKIESQYAGYRGIDDAQVNGTLTLGENISDIGGLKIAYLALQKALRKKPQGRIDGLTQDQRFFLSFAQAWRSRYRDEQERLQMRTGQHSLPRFRVKGPVAHMPEFAKAFSCAPDKALLSEGARSTIW